MLQLLCHLVGDYVLQNHWMAANKLTSKSVAVLHASVYTVPFLLTGILCPELLAHRDTVSWWAFFWIWFTHFLIDHYQIAAVWVKIYGVGEPGILWFSDRSVRPVSNNPSYISNKAPVWLATWLKIIVDNTMHLVINYSCLTFL